MTTHELMTKEDYLDLKEQLNRLEEILLEKKEKPQNKDYAGLDYIAEKMGCSVSSLKKSKRYFMPYFAEQKEGTGGRKYWWKKTTIDNHLAKGEEQLKKEYLSHIKQKGRTKSK